MRRRRHVRPSMTISTIRKQRSSAVSKPLVPILSPYQAEPLLRARQDSRSTLLTSPDLGLTEVDVLLTSEGACFPEGSTVGWEDLEMICDSKRSGRLTGHCYAIEDGVPREISGFSSAHNRLYSLMPTPGAPTLLISSIPMHRIKGTEPYADTLAKIRAAAKDLLDQHKTVIL